MLLEVHQAVINNKPRSLFPGKSSKSQKFDIKKRRESKNRDESALHGTSDNPSSDDTGWHHLNSDMIDEHYVQKKPSRSRKKVLLIDRTGSEENRGVVLKVGQGEYRNMSAKLKKPSRDTTQPNSRGFSPIMQRVKTISDNPYMHIIRENNVKGGYYLNRVFKTRPKNYNMNKEEYTKGVDGTRDAGVRIGPDQEGNGGEDSGTRHSQPSKKNPLEKLSFMRKLEESVQEKLINKKFKLGNPGDSEASKRSSFSLHMNSNSMGSKQFPKHINRSNFEKTDVSFNKRSHSQSGIRITTVMSDIKTLTAKYNLTKLI